MVTDTNRSTVTLTASPSALIQAKADIEARLLDLRTRRAAAVDPETIGFLDSAIRDRESIADAIEAAVYPEGWWER